VTTDTQLACANIEVVQRAYDAWDRDDREAWLEFWAPNGEWDMSEFEGWPESPRYRGRNELAKFWDLWHGMWDDLHIDVPEVRAFGDEVFTVFHQRGRGKESGAEVHMKGGGINLLREGRVVRYKPWSDPEVARRAAGAEGGGLDLVRALWSVNPPNAAAAFADDGFVEGLRSGMEPVLTEDFEFSLAEPDSPAIGGTWQGFDGLVAGMREWLSEWETYRIEPETIIDTGPCVVFLGREIARSRSAGIDFNGESGSVYFLEEGKIRRLDAYQSHGRALEAAGLSRELAE
jgi:ketosteroid isomerase-like protein